MIEGVKVIKLPQYPDERGTVSLMLKKSDPHFTSFGQVYFSTIYPGVIKGWHLNEVMALNYCVPYGMIKLVLYDDRPNSSTKGELMEIFMGGKNYVLVHIPTGVWNGFKCIGGKEAILCNCAESTYEENKQQRISPFDKKVPYNWDLKLE